jgi:hemolysin III
VYHGERFNAWTHLLGAVAALVGGTWLVIASSLLGDALKIVGVSVYSGSLLLLYSVSTTYHSVRGRAKTILRKLDHLSIYLLIAGSYTPFCLVSLKGAWGWTLFGIVWSLAVLGMLQELKPRSEARVLSIVIYAVMGWIVLIALGPLYRALGPGGLAWLVAGGASYTIGILFFAYDERFRHWHGIWHLFVIAGSLLHFIAVWQYVLPARVA